MTLLLATTMVWFSWLPLELDPPMRVDNQVETTGSVATFSGVGVVEVPAAANALRTAGAGEEVRLELRLRPASTEQEGPARIAVLATDLRNHGLLVGQEGADLVVRRQRTLAGQTQEREVRIPDALEAGRWELIEVHYTDRLAVTAGGRTLVDPGFPAPAQELPRVARFTLGAETSGNHPWEGEIDSATLHLGDRSIDLLDPDVARTSRRLWLLPARLDETGIRPTGDQLATAASHLLLSWVLGVGVVVSLPRLRRPTVLLVAWAGAVSVVNLAKILIATRHPSLATALLQTAAGWIGIVQVLAVRRRRQQKAGRSDATASAGHRG